MSERLQGHRTKLYANKMREGRARDEDWLGNSRKKIGGNNGKGGRDCKQEIRNRGGKEQNGRRKGGVEGGKGKGEKEGRLPPVLISKGRRLCCSLPETDQKKS